MKFIHQKFKKENFYVYKIYIFEYNFIEYLKILFYFPSLLNNT